MLDLGSLGGTDSEPTALNQKGDVVGFSTLEGDLSSHPFLWSKGQLTDLGTLGGENGTTNWINDRGDIAGKADLSGPAPQNHDAVLWKNGKMIDLGVLPDDSCSNAYYVNSHRQVVGTSESRELCSMGVGQHAFLWQQGGPMVDLNTLISPGSNLQLTYAVAINDRGEIAGFGVPPACAPRDYEQCGHAYVLIPCGEGEECANVTLPGADVLPSTPANNQNNPIHRMPRRRLGPMNKVRVANTSSEPNALGSNVDAPAVESAAATAPPFLLESLDAGIGFSTTSSCVLGGRPCSPGYSQCCGTLKCEFNGGSTRVGYACK
jgi:probable HAF family extracellular repeat protein